MATWLESTRGERFPLEGNCSLGRSQGNTIRLNSAGASRRHAHIHAQQNDGRVEYWLADWGSTNGTLHNARRVTIPCLLKPGDRISILEDQFTFHQTTPAVMPEVEDSGSGPTKVWRSQELCWLLMVDIKGFTRLSQQLDADALSLKVGTWLRQCRDAIEAAGGVVDKFLGDAIFAYWTHNEQSARTVFAAVQQIAEIQKGRDPDFRIVLHRGDVILAGGAGGANNVSGPEVIAVFRMEKVCSKLNTDSIVSDTARRALPAEVCCQPVGEHPLDGFPGTFAFHRLGT
ncbi:MAG TPA: adenylate/guanylate cyclase domain-containing protein [Opitutaceae bacterium]|nr:adenylate/guanylate cyclase domain-containing protein [Opitutaceae bacterium]